MCVRERVCAADVALFDYSQLSSKLRTHAIRTDIDGCNVAVTTAVLLYG